MYYFDRPLTPKVRVAFQVSPYEISGNQSCTGTVFSPTTSVFPWQYHSTTAPHIPSSLDHSADFRKSSTLTAVRELSLFKTSIILRPYSNKTLLTAPANTRFEPGSLSLALQHTSSERRRMKCTLMYWHMTCDCSSPQLLQGCSFVLSEPVKSKQEWDMTQWERTFRYLLTFTGHWSL
jgi:hypothetical protein